MCYCYSPVVGMVFYTKADVVMNMNLIMTALQLLIIDCNRQLQFNPSTLYQNTYFFLTFKMPQIARNFPNFWKLQAVENQQKFRRNSLRLFEADPYGCHSQEGTRMGGRRVPGPHHPTIHFPYDNK